MRKFSRALGPKIADSNRADREDCKLPLLAIRNVWDVPVTPTMLAQYDRAVEQDWQPALALAVCMVLLAQSKPNPDWQYFEGILREQTRRSHGYWTKKLRWLK